MDRLLEMDPLIGQTRFHWLRSAPEAPGASNLVGLTERIAFLRRYDFALLLFPPRLGKLRIGMDPLVVLIF
ncbi:hypothetical protein SY94_5016 (plasmid) [Agrobacterium tumefaciens]|nr:hypothetical protein SY94_5016 [Agrobacterium tumefaciens]